MTTWRTANRRRKWKALPPIWQRGKRPHPERAWRPDMALEFHVGAMVDSFVRLHAERLADRLFATEGGHGLGS